MHNALLSTNNCCDNAFQAVRSNHIQCLTVMNRLNLEERDINQQTPLHVAAKLGRLQAIEYVIFLLQHEAPRTQDAVSMFGENPALVAAGEGQTQSVELLLKNSTSKHAVVRAQQRDVNGTTVLMAAVARGDNDLALWLLRRFGKTLAMLPNNFHMLPVHVAAALGNNEFIRAAIKYDHRMVNYRDQFVQGGCLACARYLIEKAGADICIVSDKGQSLLHVACLAGHAHIVRWIIQRSAPNSVLWTTKDNANAIHCASYSGSVAALGVLLRIIPQKRRRQVLTLRDSRGNSPLHLAAISNHTDAVQFLLENGAEPRLLNNAGETAETIARVQKNFQLEKLLLYWKERKQKRTKELQSVRTAKPLALVDNAYSSGYWSITSRTLPDGSSQIVPIIPATTGSLQQQGVPDHSSQGNFTVNTRTNGEMKSYELRPITYFASDEGGRIYEDHSVQTDRDSLHNAVKILDADEWHESLAAVAQIDRVLQEVNS
ncbi:unnamed protein product [Gongylonema pulchrum]|uniref:ANK_REP_REGION domain-containing protein n=1 Tax=Gongylonema pulchrum TaxID=637853 RepID=A0A183DQV2_9BILA|nr:unnamed protein product [Gongylonema pulchrum]